MAGGSLSPGRDMLSATRVPGGCCLSHQVEKRLWARPELIVLTRARPEEAVLQACKGLPIEGTSTHDNHCETGIGCGVRCTEVTAS